MSSENLSVLPAKRNTSTGVVRRTGISKSRQPGTKFKGTLAYAASRIQGGRTVFMEYARIASQSDERLMPLVEKWDSLSKSDKRYVNLDDLCEAVGIRLGMVVGAVADAAFEYNADVSKLMAAVAHPAVVQATIDSALTPQGVQDRRMLHQHLGFVPTPTGPVFNVSAKAGAMSSVEERGLPDFEETVFLVHRILTEEADDE
jgi:hypothetical protein